MNMDCTDTKSDQSCLQENTDFWGADLASGRAINLDQCETFCRDTRDCVSITYRSSDSQCWLKYNRFGAAGPSPRNGLTSLNMECKVAPQNDNCKRIDVDFWGADIGHVTAESLDKCEELCRETEGCVSLTYRFVFLLYKTGVDNQQHLLQLLMIYLSSGFLGNKLIISTKTSIINYSCQDF